MAYMDEIELGDDVLVTDLQTGKTYEGRVVALHPDATGGPDSKVDVEYTSGRLVRVGPSFITLKSGEE